MFHLSHAIWRNRQSELQKKKKGGAELASTNRMRKKAVLSLTLELLKNGMSSLQGL